MTAEKPKLPAFCDSTKPRREQVTLAARSLTLAIESLEAIIGPTSEVLEAYMAIGFLVGTADTKGSDARH
jgi:hypothetical protein